MISELLVPKITEQVRRRLFEPAPDTPPEPPTSPEPPTPPEPSGPPDELLDRVVVIANDEEKRLWRLLTYIKQLSDEGYSFRIVVDPDHEETAKIFHWEGESFDSILSVTSDEITQEELTEEGVVPPESSVSEE